MQKKKRRTIKRSRSPNIPTYSEIEIKSMKKAFPNSVCGSLFESDSSTDSAAGEEEDDDDGENMPPTLITAVCMFKGQDMKKKKD